MGFASIIGHFRLLKTYPIDHKYWHNIGVAKKLNLKGVAAFAISPDAADPVLAAFVPEGKGQPGYVGLWKIQDMDKSPNSVPAFARRSFFRVTLHYLADIILILICTTSERSWAAETFH